MEEWGKKEPRASLTLTQATLPTTKQTPCSTWYQMPIFQLALDLWCHIQVIPYSSFSRWITLYQMTIVQFVIILNTLNWIELQRRHRVATLHLTQIPWMVCSCNKQMNGTSSEFGFPRKCDNIFWQKMFVCVTRLHVALNEQNVYLF